MQKTFDFSGLFGANWLDNFAIITFPAKNATTREFA